MLEVGSYMGESTMIFQICFYIFMKTTNKFIENEFKQNIDSLII